MKYNLIIWGLCFAQAPCCWAQETPQALPSIHQIPKELLAGKGLEKMPQSDSSRIVYQKKVYDGVDLGVFMVAIGTGITNEFESFPLEEFIFWMNGKAVVEPHNEEPFEIQTGDYFIQAKGFRGKWNFINIDGVHLELALIAKDRPDSTFKSPMSRAIVIDRDIISGVKKPVEGRIYEGPELTVNLLTEQEQLGQLQHERMLHILNGVLTVTTEEQVRHDFFPGDFFIVEEACNCTWEVQGVQNIRILEVHKTKI